MEKNRNSKKKLSEMSLEELWQLFPIFLVEHRKEWKEWYEYEERCIRDCISAGVIKRISHIGSTAVPNLRAKNIVDILIEVNNPDDLMSVRENLAASGWICMCKDKTRISMNKGYTESGFAEKVFHVHIRLSGDNDELYFRDYLLDNPDAAKEYEALKLSLQKWFEHDRDGYTAAKSDFIRKYTDIARTIYGNRYA